LTATVAPAASVTEPLEVSPLIQVPLVVATAHALFAPEPGVANAPVKMAAVVAPLGR
jgi:hypothetical protein